MPSAPIAEPTPPSWTASEAHSSCAECGAVEVCAKCRVNYRATRISQNGSSNGALNVNPRRRDAEVEKRQGEETGEAATYEGPADVAVGEHAHGPVDVSDILVVHVNTPDPSCAAHLAFDVDGGTIGECCDRRCRVSCDLQ